MPQGLTRGFAIGVMTAAYTGILRTRTLGASGTLANFATVLALVLTVGVVRFSGPQAVVDAVQISSATAGGLLALPKLLPSRDGEPRSPRGQTILRTAGALIMISAICTAATSLAAELTSFQDRRDPVSIAIAVLLGLSVATVSSRVLLPADHDMQPTLVQLDASARRGPVLRYYAEGLLSAVVIGTGGGIVGALTVNAKYGAALAIWFGLVAGIPIGLAVGFVNHRAAPASSPELRAVTATPSTDRAIALGIMVGIAAISGLFIMLGEAVLRDRIDRLSQLAVQPVHGILFGLTIGVVVAGFKTAWPSFVIGHKWLAAQKMLPWPMETFLKELWTAGILVMEGNSYAFRHLEYQNALLRARPEWAERYLLVGQVDRVS